MIGGWFRRGKDNTPALPAERGPLACAIGGALRIDTLGIEAMLASGEPAMGPPVGGDFVVTAIGVARLDGAPLGAAEALVRGLGSIFSIAVLGIGCLWILRDPERQARMASATAHLLDLARVIDEEAIEEERMVEPAAVQVVHEHALVDRNGHRRRAGRELP